MGQPVVEGDAVYLLEEAGEATAGPIQADVGTPVGESGEREPRLVDVEFPRVEVEDGWSVLAVGLSDPGAPKFGGSGANRLPGRDG